MFYAALHKPDAGAGCPKGCCWRRQFQVPLDWVRAFLAEQHGDLCRVFNLDAHLRRGEPITITTDASPYGIGAVLEVGGVITSFFSDGLSALDRALLSIEPSPSSVDQQVLEAFAILVALRHWCDQWRGRRVRLSVRTDNVAALTLLCKMQPHSARLGLIAREIALDISASCYTPDVAEHVPGISNKAGDALSRSGAPVPPPLPTYLKNELRTQPVKRGVIVKGLLVKVQPTHAGAM